jgi:hypothetical protein
VFEAYMDKPALVPVNTVTGGVCNRFVSAILAHRDWNPDQISHLHTLLQATPFGEPRDQLRRVVDGVVDLLCSGRGDRSTRVSCWRDSALRKSVCESWLYSGDGGVAGRLAEIECLLDLPRL